MQRTGADSERKSSSEARDRASDTDSTPGHARPVASLQRAVGNQAIQSSVGDGVTADGDSGRGSNSEIAADPERERTPGSGSGSPVETGTTV